MAFNTKYFLINNFPFLFFFFQINNVIAGNEIWPLDRPDGMPAIVSLEVMCGKDHMDVHLSFSHPFEGIVSSKGKIVLFPIFIFNCNI